MLADISTSMDTYILRRIFEVCCTPEQRVRGLGDCSIKQPPRILSCRHEDQQSLA